MIKVKNIEFGGDKPFVLIAGPCVVENSAVTNETASSLKKICADLDIPFVFKASYRKANRTSINSFMGLGDMMALKILKDAGERYDVPLITDVHTAEDCRNAANYVDILQIPAFLCRQTDLLLAAGETGKAVNIKKGQFLAPWDMKHAAAKVARSGNEKILLTERGTTFGYGNLVVDMRSLIIMRELGFPVVMDATHSVQMPGTGETTGGNPGFIAPLARAAVAVGIDALFMEVHPEPAKALSDAASQYPLDKVKSLLEELKELDYVIKSKKN